MRHRLYLLIIFLVVIQSSEAQTVTRGPYLQSLSSTSVKIMWQTQDSARSIVYLGDQPGNLTLAYSDEEHKIDHIALIEGLTPATVYFYGVSVGDAIIAGGNDRHTFTTAPQIGTAQKVKFWVTGDFGSKSQSQIDVKNAFLEKGEPLNTNFWLWLGDNAYDDGKQWEYQERVFDKVYGYDTLIKHLPFFSTPGNHDYNSVNRFAPPEIHRGPYFDVVEVPQNAEAGGLPSGTELYYSFDYGNVHFVSINSEAFQYTFFKGSVMEDWLRSDLSANQQPWTIVFWHQPPYSKGSHDSDDAYELFMQAMRRNYNPIIEKFGVDLLLCGHSHVYERSYLVKGHYGKSGSFNPATMLLDGSSGNPDLNESYVKYLNGDNKGTVYAVVGNSGKSTSDAKLNHPVFAHAEGGSGIVGSMIVEVEGNTLTGSYLRGDGTIGDKFQIIKPDLEIVTNTTTNNLELIDGLSIYPNPMESEAYVEFNVKKSQKITIDIVNVTGQLLKNIFSGKPAIGAFKEKFDTSDLANGTYLLRIQSEDQQIAEQIIQLK